MVNGRNTRKSRELYRLPYLTKNLTKFSFYSIYHLLSATYRKSGGEGGIRTPGTLASTSDFESGAFNRALPPLRFVYNDLELPIDGPKVPVALLVALCSSARATGFA